MHGVLISAQADLPPSSFAHALRADQFPAPVRHQPILGIAVLHRREPDHGTPRTDDP